MTESLKPSEVLERAAALIEPEGAWGQGHYSNGSEHAPSDRDATCWCVMGALYRDPEVPDHTIQAARSFFREVVGTPVVRWNDAPERTQPEVVAALRKAAELAKAEGC